MPTRTQLGAERAEHIENHPDTREILARESAAWLVRIDDPCGTRQRIAWKMMVGDEHVDTRRMCCGDSFDARDAVVDRDNEMGLSLRGERNDLRSQPVAELESVGNQKIDAGAHRLQAADADRARGRSVGVVVGNDQYPLAARHCVRESL